MANRAYSRKAAGIHQQQKKTPHSVSHAGQCYFWSFARSSSSNTGCNRIYNKINGGTSFRFGGGLQLGFKLRRDPDYETVCFCHLSAHLRSYSSESLDFRSSWRSLIRALSHMRQIALN